MNVEITMQTDVIPPKMLPPKPKHNVWSWRSQIFRGRFYQAILVLAIVAVVAFLVINLNQNLKSRGIQSGFDFLSQPAGFDIGESLMSFEVLIAEDLDG